VLLSSISSFSDTPRPFSVMSTVATFLVVDVDPVDGPRSTTLIPSSGIDDVLGRILDISSDA